MAQSVPPGDIHTQPGSKIVFNAPYDDKHTYHIKVFLYCGLSDNCCWGQRKMSLWRFPAIHLMPRERTLTTIVSPSNGQTHRMVPPNNSAVNGSRAMVWFAARTSRSNITYKICRSVRSKLVVFLMAQSVPPGDIHTQPGSKIVFNAPYDDKHTYHIKITNAGGRRIGWAIKTTNMRRLGVDPPC
uniref:Major sperm protein n=1 Tax=Elaeophora elaphi TaxID=1147741 RepID=A0A0R3S7G8_9BILA